MIDLDNISVAYGADDVVHDVSLGVPAGGWLGLIGPNGAGKSSVLKAIAGACGYRGTISIGGDELSTLSRRERSARVAYLPQTPVLPDDMTGLEYVLLGRTPHIGYFGTETADDRAIASAALRRLDLAGFADRFLSQMSGGERQRVVLARAIATEANVLLLDEPTTALDIGHQQQALDLVDELRRTEGLTVITALHDLTLAGMYCDQLALVDGGRLVASGAPNEVLTADSIGSIYGADVAVTVIDGMLIISPQRRTGPGLRSA